MMRRFRHWALAVLAALVPSLAYAQVEVPFFFPVAVGGPVTKIIDGMAADFEKENPGIKVKPIYTGTYQDSITCLLYTSDAADERSSVDLGGPRLLQKKKT